MNLELNKDSYFNKIFRLSGLLIRNVGMGAKNPARAQLVATGSAMG